MDRKIRRPKGMIDVVIDSDAYNEIDDQFAISYALCAPETFNVKAIYAAPFFNTRSKSPEDGMEKSWKEIRKLLSLTGKDVPVFKGSRRYMEDEDTPVVSEAAEHLVKLAIQYTEEFPLYVVALGVLTDIASAILLVPEIRKRIVVVALNGNSIYWPTNDEFNARQDIASARVVFSSCVPLVILPCQGVVSMVRTTGPELTHFLKDRNPLCNYLIEQTISEAESYAAGKVWSRVIWDIAPIGWIRGGTNPMMKDILIPTPIPEYDNHYSKDFRRHPCLYVWSIDRDALFGDLFGCLTGNRNLAVFH